MPLFDMSTRDWLLKGVGGCNGADGVCIKTKGDDK